MEHSSKQAFLSVGQHPPLQHLSPHTVKSQPDGGGGGGFSPELEDEVLDSPLEDEVLDPPLEDEVLDSPLEDEVLDPPLEDEVLDPPLEDEVLDPPLELLELDDELLELDDELLELDDELLELEDELLELEDELLELDDELLELEDELLDDAATQLSTLSLHLLPGTVPSQHVGTVPTAELFVIAASAHERVFIEHSAVKPPLVQDTEPLEQKGVEVAAKALYELIW